MRVWAWVLVSAWCGGEEVCGCAEGVIPEFWRPQTVSHPRCGAGEKTRLLSSKRSLRLIHRLRFSVRGWCPTGRPSLGFLASRLQTRLFCRKLPDFQDHICYYFWFG